MKKLLIITLFVSNVIRAEHTEGNLVPLCVKVENWFHNITSSVSEGVSHATDKTVETTRAVRDTVKEATYATAQKISDLGNVTAHYADNAKNTVINQTAHIKDFIIAQALYTKNGVKNVYARYGAPVVRFATNTAEGQFITATATSLTIAAIVHKLTQKIPNRFKGTKGGIRFITNSLASMTIAAFLTKLFPGDFPIIPGFKAE